MKFHEFGDKDNPHIMLIHGGGNAWWNYLRQARALSSSYHVILPTLDGHGEEYSTAYISTEDTARKLMDYIENNCGGRLFALCGVSLGGQIVIELLSMKPDLAQKAVIDGSICYPQPALARYSIAMVRICWKLLFGRSACRFQLAVMDRFFSPKMRYPKELADYYMQDMPRLQKDTLYAIYRTYMMKYRLKESLSRTSAQVLYMYGSKEMKCVKKSAELFKSAVPSCVIYEAAGYNHGYLSIYLPGEWLETVLPFFKM